MSVLSKRDVFTDLWKFCGEHEDSGLVRIVFNCLVPGVQVPDIRPGTRLMVLDYDPYADNPPVSDLKIGTTALEAKLSFGGVQAHTVIPWSSIEAIVCDAVNITVHYEPRVRLGVPTETSEELTPVERPKLKLVD